MHDAVEPGHVQVAAARPIVDGDVADPGADEHERGGRPFAVGGRHLGEHVAHEVDHAPLVSGLRQHLADGGDEPGAPVADHEPDALQAALDHGPYELLPAGLVLLHALGHADDLPVARVVHADGDQHAHVLDRPAP